MANRYFGAYQDGTLKVRGIEARRRDTPSFIRQTQLDMIDILAEGEDIRGFRRQVPEAVAYAMSRLDLLRTGKVPLKKLVVTNRLSRDPSEFTTRTVNALVARQLAKQGVQLSPGESLRYILVPGPEKGRPWELLDDKDLQGTDLVTEGKHRDEGIAILEAPRGTLFHHYRINDTDQITMANLIVSTTNNNEPMNRAVQRVCETHLSGHEITEGLLNHVEVAIRAYDPCFSCSTHFLEVKWL